MAANMMLPIRAHRSRGDAREYDGGDGCGGHSGYGNCSVQSLCSASHCTEPLLLHMCARVIRALAGAGVMKS
eukprot:1179551-Alexandrium_andersonii.AAC.1